MKLAPSRKLLSLGLFLSGAVLFSYVLGAAAMFFELPTSHFLGKAFIGARAWDERTEMAAASVGELSAPVMGGIDKPDKTFDGYTLIATGSTSAPSTRAYLLNMRRQLVHRWEIPFSRVWSKPPHLAEPVEDSLVCFFACHLYANGDLLVVFQSLEKFPVGYGLAKLDKDSNVIWKYPAQVHHDVDVGEDGTIYAIRQETVTHLPKGLDEQAGPYKVDSLVVLSPDGKESKKPIPILQALQASSYRPLLGQLEVQNVHPAAGGRPEMTSGLTAPSMEEELQKQDLVHANSVRVLTPALAPKFPNLKAGQVLLSLRGSTRSP